MTILLSRRTTQTALPDTPIEPIPVMDLDLDDPSAPPAANAAGQLFALVRRGGVPLGTVAVLDDHPDGADVDVRALAARRFLATPAQPAGPQPVGDRDAPVLVTVVVCTLGEDPRLRTAVSSILRQSYRAIEVVVVDNRPETGSVRALLADVDDPRLRIVAERRRGLSVARNTGLAASRGDLIAYTDDDAFADPGWVESLVLPFRAHPDVMCVTGLVLPAELVTRAQVLFEEFGGFDKGFTRTVWTTRPDDGTLSALGARGDGGILFPYSAGVFGSGNNMAFRAGWLREHGAFDVSLGAGSLTKGGEDLDAFLAVMLADGVLVYEPRALIRHFARSDMDGLRTQMFGYGSGMSAVIVKHLLRSPRSAMRVLARVPAGMRRLLDPRSAKNENRTAEYPKDLKRAELRGYLAGPKLYLQSRRDARRRDLNRPAIHG